MPNIWGIISGALYEREHQGQIGVRSGSDDDSDDNGDNNYDDDYDDDDMMMLILILRRDEGRCQYCEGRR